MTIVVDTSAIVAVLFGEPERSTFLEILKRGEAAMSAASVVELMNVVVRREPQWRAEARLLLQTLGVQIVPLDEAQTRLAEEGMLRFGKGRGAPPAVLNFGDLFAYALARRLEAPLLFKGDDFGQTDLRSALTSP